MAARRVHADRAASAWGRDGLSATRAPLPIDALIVWGGATAAIAFLGHHHWSIGPAIWLAVPLGIWLSKGAPTRWGVTAPRPGRRSALELGALTLAVAGLTAWVATWGPSADRTVAAMAVHALWVAPAEELFFRGYLQGESRGRLGGLGATALAAAAFGVSHALIARSPMGLLTIGPGLLFGAVRERQGSLVGPVILHAAANVSLVLWSTTIGQG